MSKEKVVNLNFLVCILLLVAGTASAQTDTLKLSFKEAEKQFLQKNLRLIAQKYHVDASSALVKQAALWDNPTLNTEQNLYDNTHTFFNHADGNGQVYLIMSQIFRTAGKRGKQVQLAKDDARIQEAEFNDLMRNLRYNLQQDFADVASITEQNKVYVTEISSLNTLGDAIEKSYKAGNSSFKDAVRIKALLFGLQSDLAENNRQLVNLETELKTLLAVDEGTTILPQLDRPKVEALPSADQLIAQALTSRPDYLGGSIESERAKHNLSYQKSLALPDITAGVVYDKVNSYSPHYFGLQIGLPLPLFDRNQGNIRAARLDMKGQEAAFKDSELSLKHEVMAAREQYQIAASMLSEGSEDFYSKYDQLFKGMLKSYQQRQISLLEFVDFFESYKDTQLKIIAQRYNLHKAAADLNYTVGTTVINP